MDEEKNTEKPSARIVFILIGLWAVLGVILSVVLAKLHVHNYLSVAWAVPDFLILATILWYLMFKNTPSALPMMDVKARLRNRRNRVKEALESAEGALKDAEESNRDYSERLAKIEQEIAGLVGSIRREGELERDRILAEARRQVERIKNEAEFTAKQELAVAQARLKQEAVDRAVELAEELLRKTMTEDDRTRLLDEFLTKVEKTT